MENTCKSCLTTFPELKVITSQFKCGICYEFIKTPMTTSCGHSYCSICIRTWITTKQLCPTCQTEVRDESLKNNLALENCIDPYISLQNKLHEICKTVGFATFKLSIKSIPTTEHKDVHTVTKNYNGDIQAKSHHEVEVKQSPKPPTTPEHNSTATRHEFEPQVVQSPAKVPAVFLTSPKSKNQQRPKTDIFTSPTSSSISRAQNNVGASLSTQSTNIKKVPCPVCCVEIPERNINIHLDKCLTIQENAASSPPSKPEIPRREPLKKLVYHMMSEKEIRKKLQEFGLSTKGNRTQLVNRLQRYTILYNSECDSQNPRPVAEIRKQIEKDEEALNRVAPTTNKVFRISKNADETEIDEINKQYRTEHKSDFDDLIRQMRERDKKKNESLSCVTERKSEDDDDVTWIGGTSKRNRISDEESDEFSSIIKTQTSKTRRIHDSDDENLFLPKSKENSQETPVASRKSSRKNEDKLFSPVLFNEHNISSSSGEDNHQLSNGKDLSASPVLSRSPNENVNATESRLRRKKPETRLKEVEVKRPTRGKKDNGNSGKPEEQLRPTLRRGRAQQRSNSVRTVSRTPSLSPSRLEGLGEDDQDGPETPEMVFERRRRASPDGESDEEMDVGTENLSQLVSLMNETGDSSDYSQDF